MSIRMLRIALFCVMVVGFPLIAMSGNGMVAGNSVDFSPPPPGGLNPDSPAAGQITATGVTATAKGWSCTKVEITVTELATLKQVDFGTSAVVNPWQYAGTGFNKGTHSVAVKAIFTDGKVFDYAFTTQTVPVK
jgi:hypothetical protein